MVMVQFELTRIFHHTFEIDFPAVEDVFRVIFQRHLPSQLDLFDSGTHAPLPPLFNRAGDSTVGVYPVLNALATCAKMF